MKLVWVLVPVILIAALFFSLQKSEPKTTFTSTSPAPPATPTATQAPPVVIKDFVDTDIDFSPQAPFADWKDPRQQDACEEAAILMAVYHRQGKSLTKQKALEEILAIAKFQTENFKEYRDTSASDSAKRILLGYFNYSDYRLVNNVTLEEIISELNAGNLVIAPANGRALKNPYFTPPGPERHNLLIKGYDKKTEEFITNDPGVGNGKNFRYPMDNLYNAIRDYPTGYHVPILETHKNVIIIF